MVVAAAAAASYAAQQHKNIVIGQKGSTVTIKLRRVEL